MHGTRDGSTCNLTELRADVRAFIAAELSGYDDRRRAESWQGFDRDFSRKLGAKGWIGMTWPVEYGGREKSLQERYIVQEELLAVGAPVGAHWVAERQSGPLLLRVGTEQQKKSVLPRIVAGELAFCIGMSESEAGSDLAAIRTRAHRTEDGWRVTGRKLWTTGAGSADMMIVLARTAPVDPEKRHHGMSQFLVDLTTPGVSINPIRDMAGASHFNEVVLDDVALPADALLGAEGAGWQQVMAELALERSGPERFLSCLPLVSAFRDELDRDDAASVEYLGRAFADLVTLRELSRDVTDAFSAGREAAVDAAIVKDLGAGFEQSAVERIADLTHWDGTASDAQGSVPALLGALSLTAPSFSLRGGTREILRGIIAKAVAA